MSGMSDLHPPTGRLRARTAEEIRVLLARRRMSAAELARRTGMRQQALSRRMTGETAWDVDDLEVIAAALGVTVFDLLGGASGPEGSQTTAPKPTRPTRPTRPTPTPPSRPTDNRPLTRPTRSAHPAHLRRPALL